MQWGDVGGLEGVKQRLKEAVQWPHLQPEALARLGAEPPKGMLCLSCVLLNKTITVGIASYFWHEDVIHSLLAEQNSVVAACAWQPLTVHPHGSEVVVDWLIQAHLIFPLHDAAYVQGCC